LEIKKIPTTTFQKTFFYAPFFLHHAPTLAASKTFKKVPKNRTSK
jgi:hypothetical protein